jgi:hypothetical protein
MKRNCPPRRKLWSATHTPGRKGVCRSSEDANYVYECSDTGVRPLDRRQLDGRRTRRACSCAIRSSDSARCEWTASGSERRASGAAWDGNTSCPLTVGTPQSSPAILGLSHRPSRTANLMAANSCRRARYRTAKRIPRDRDDDAEQTAISRSDSHLRFTLRASSETHGRARCQ